MSKPLDNLIGLRDKMTGGTGVQAILAAASNVTKRGNVSIKSISGNTDWMGVKPVTATLSRSGVSGKYINYTAVADGSSFDCGFLEAYAPKDGKYTVEVKASGCGKYLDIHVSK